jgi:hypothetical protein
MSCVQMIRKLVVGAVIAVIWIIGVNTPYHRALAFDHTDLAMWLDASDINGSGAPQNIAEGASIPLWTDKSGQGNNAFQAPVGDPAGGYPGASGGVLHAEMFGPLPPAPIFENTLDVTPSGLPAVRFDTCNGGSILGCTVPPPSYPHQTGLMTNFHAHPDPSMVINEGYPAVPDLTIVTVVQPRWINDFHIIWSFDGDAGGHNRSLGAVASWPPTNEGGLLTDGGARIFVPTPQIMPWMVIIQSYQYGGTPTDPNPQPTKLYINSPTPIVAGGAESIQGQFDAPMTIGFFPYNVTNGSNITMLLSEMLVFKRTLSDAEVNSLGFELAQKYGIAASFTQGGVPGDYNSDGIVDAADYTVWRDHLGQTFALPNEDPASTPGQVTIEDYSFWKAHFGATSGSGSTSGATVPEPSSGVMLLIAAALWSCVGCRWNGRRA